MQNKLTIKVRKSVVLGKDELTQLKKYVRQFNTTTEAAENIDIHRNVLIRILVFGSGAPTSISKIRSVINSAKVA